MGQLYKLSSRSNINVYNYPEFYRQENDDRRIVVYDDHRTILDVLYFAIQEGHFGGDITNIISFDRHDDSVDLLPKKKQKAKAVRKSCMARRNEEKMWQFIEFELSGLDDDWVRAGMELGLIKHYIGFGHKSIDAGNIDQGYENYRTHDKSIHHLYSNGHLSFEMGSRGVIGDESYSWQHKRSCLLDDLQFHSWRFDSERIVPFVFDIDLDCFATDCEDYLIAWPESIFAERYEKNLRVRSFIRNLITRSSLITICREPGCCGGIGEANRILELLDYYWFDGALKTRSFV